MIYAAKKINIPFHTASSDLKKFTHTSVLGNYAIRFNRLSRTELLF